MNRRHDADAVTTGRATRVISTQITIAAAVIIIFILIAASAYIFDQAQPAELLEKPKPGETKIYVDAMRIVIALIFTACIATVWAWVLSWLIARRAVRPLETALHMQRTFVADASHELRTPVAIIGARVEVLQQELRDGQAVDPIIADLKSDVRGLGEILNDLLLAAMPPEDIDPTSVTDANATVAQAIDSLQIIAGQSHVVLRLDSKDHIVTRVPEVSLRRCIVALVDNALKHSPEHSFVDVTIRQCERSAFAVDVSDHGTGITGIDQAHLFDRFARGATEGHARRANFGLGLALVGEIAARYRGSIVVSDTSSVGTTFRLTLPCL